MDPSETFAQLKVGAAQIVSDAELIAKFALKRPLRVKLGVDPTSPDIHLGHTVALRKLRQFQELGHTAVLIVGDFTAMVGDPSGRSATRPQLTREEVLAHAETYRAQAFKVVDPDRTEVVFNGEWFRKMTYEDVLRLNSRVTLQQMLQREDFHNRMRSAHAIHAHEIQYPMMQGWDSVMVRADVELGGTDQLFNNLLGRELQKQEGQAPQVVMLTPILEGLDGTKKMSKSLGNYIGVAESPQEMFGKLMSISDELMGRYYRLLLNREIASNQHPLEAKKQLAQEITATYHSQAEAQRVLDEWNARFTERRLSDVELPHFPAKTSDIITLVVEAFAQCGIARSKSDARRLVTQGSVQLDGAKISDPKLQVTLTEGSVLRLDKTRAVRVANA